VAPRYITHVVTTIGLPPRALDSRNYSSNVLVLEYSFNSTSGRKFQFPVPAFQINELWSTFYANLAPSTSSCKLRLNSFEIALQPIPREGRGRKGGENGGENHTGTYLHFGPWSTVYSKSHAALLSTSGINGYSSKLS